MTTITFASKNTLFASNSLPMNLLYVFAGSILLAVSAKIQIPFYPVPMTMQTFMVLLIGFGLGSRLGVLTILLYLFEGAMGLPVFADTPQKGIGLAYMMGPTGGYLLGFVLAAYITGRLAECSWDRTPLYAAMAAILGLTAIYACGLLWLGTLLGWDKPILAWGLFPFVYGEAVKLALLAAVLPLAWGILPKKR